MKIFSAKRVVAALLLAFALMAFAPLAAISFYAMTKPVGPYDATQARQIVDREKKRLEEYQLHQPSPDNGWALVAEWFTRSGKTSFKDGAALFTKLHDNKIPYSSIRPEVEAFVQRFGPYQKTMDESLTKRYFLVPVAMRGRWIDPAGRIPDYLKLRAFAQGLVVKARYHLERGETAQAIECYLLGDKLGIRLSEAPVNLIHEMISVAIRATVRRGFLDEIEWIAQGAPTLKPWWGADSSHFREAMDSEFYFLEGIYSLLISGELSLADFMHYGFERDKEDTPGFFTRAGRKVLAFYLRPYLFREKAKLEEWYLSVRAGMLLPTYRESRERLDAVYAKFEKEIAEDRIGATTIILIPNVMRAHSQSVMLQSTDGAIAILTSLYHFKKDRRQFPDTLTELVPKYIQTLPKDPYSPDGLYFYRKEKGDFILYSCGLDGKDHGGRAKEKYQLSVQSGSDIIFHPIDAESKP